MDRVNDRIGAALLPLQGQPAVEKVAASLGVVLRLGGGPPGHV